MSDDSNALRSGHSSGLLARAGLLLAVGMQPAVWAAGRWGVLGPGGAGIRALDRRGLEWMAAHRSATLDTFFAAVTHLGSFAVTGPLALVLAAALARQGLRRSAWFVVGGFGGAALLAQAGKLLVARPRPSAGDLVVAMPSDLSFPSAHATHAMALALVAWLVARSRRGSVAACGATAVALVAVSRVYLQVHHPSDVAAGLGAAAAWVLGLWLATGSRA